MLKHRIRRGRNGTRTCARSCEAGSKVPSAPMASRAALVMNRSVLHGVPGTEVGGMEPVSVALLLALAGGVGGEAGKQVWTELVRLVRRTFRRGSSGDHKTYGVNSPDVPLDAARLAEQLSELLSTRAEVDPDFQKGLRAWMDRAETRRIEQRINASGQNAMAMGVIGGNIYYHELTERLSELLSDVLGRVSGMRETGGKQP